MGVIQKDWMIIMLFLGQIYGSVLLFNLHLVDLYIAKVAPLHCITKILSGLLSVKISLDPFELGCATSLSKFLGVCGSKEIFVEVRVDEVVVF